MSDPPRPYHPFSEPGAKVVPAENPSLRNVMASEMEGLPKRFGKYTLIRKLATGGMAELFLAIQRSVAGFEKLLVIKRILPAMNQDRAFIDMFLHEARIAATLSHPNIVQIFDVGQVDHTYYIAMEHVHGEDLRSMVRQMKKKGIAEFPLEHAIAIVLGMCSGLAYAHEKRDLDGTALRIVHRDISPQNVIVGFSGDVKIVDFGIAKSDSKLIEETRDGKLKGKVPYMSPEQARGVPVDWRTDIFATGVMLFELTTGKRLFKGASEYETLKLICDREYPLPSMVKAGYSPELELIVMRALAKDREDRFQSAREMQLELEEFVRSHGIRVSGIALTEFMGNLFEQKLQFQKEALLQGKALADIIDLQDPGVLNEDSGQHDGHRSGSAGSTPGATRTVTDLGIRRRRDRGSTGLAFGVAATLALILGIGGGTALWLRNIRSKVPAIDVTSSVAKKGTVSIVTDPPGAAIWIDGDLRAEATPFTVTQLPFDSPLTIKLTKDGFEQEKQTVTLTAAAPSSQLNVPLSRGSVVAEVNVTPADVKPVFALDGRPVIGNLYEGLTSDAPHTLTVDAPGYRSQEVTFAGAPSEHKVIDIAMVPASAGSAADSGPLAASSGSNGGGSSHHSGGTHGNGSSSAGGGGAPAGNGKLNVGASGGWCNLSVDGQGRGATPVAGIQLSAGVHHLTCSTPDGKTLTSLVTVAAETTTRYKFNVP
jgi:serine/threonine protein kinase